MGSLNYETMRFALYCIGDFALAVIFIERFHWSWEESNSACVVCYCCAKHNEHGTQLDRFASVM